MSRFREELRVIPRAAWIVGIILGVVMAVVLGAVFVLNPDPELRRFPLVLLPAFLPLVAALVVFVYVVLIGYVYGDAKRRQMHYVMWTLLAIFIPDAIGIILYFILRDPLSKPCPECAKPLRAGFVFCPFCGTALQATCQNCGRGVEAVWPHCPHCGSKLPSPAPHTA